MRSGRSSRVRPHAGPAPEARRRKAHGSLPGSACRCPAPLREAAAPARRARSRIGTREFSVRGRRGAGSGRARARGAMPPHPDAGRPGSGTRAGRLGAARRSEPEALALVAAGLDRLAPRAVARGTSAPWRRGRAVEVVGGPPAELVRPDLARHRWRSGGRGRGGPSRTLELGVADTTRPRERRLVGAGRAHLELARRAHPRSRGWCARVSAEVVLLARGGRVRSTVQDRRRSGPRRRASRARCRRRRRSAARLPSTAFRIISGMSFSGTGRARSCSSSW